MIYSISQQKNVPITVTKEIYYCDDGLVDVIRYDVYTKSNEKQHVGYVDLQNTKNGVHVSYIKNEHPDLFKHFGQVADQIELEHCLKRGIKNPYIQSVAAIGSHIQHYKRGKRFINEGVNILFDYILKNLKKGELVTTGCLGVQKMYMPVNLINEIKEKIKINPLLKL